MNSNKTLLTMMCLVTIFCATVNMAFANTLSEEAIHAEVTSASYFEHTGGNKSYLLKGYACSVGTTSSISDVQIELDNGSSLKIINAILNTQQFVDSTCDQSDGFQVYIDELTLNAYSGAKLVVRAVLVNGTVKTVRRSKVYKAVPFQSDVSTLYTGIQQKTNGTIDVGYVKKGVFGGETLFVDRVTTTKKSNFKGFGTHVWTADITDLTELSVLTGDSFPQWQIDLHTSRVNKVKESIYELNLKYLRMSYDALSFDESSTNNFEDIKTAVGSTVLLNKDKYETIKSFLERNDTKQSLIQWTFDGIFAIANSSGQNVLNPSKTAWFGMTNGYYLAKLHEYGLLPDFFTITNEPDLSSRHISPSLIGQVYGHLGFFLNSYYPNVLNTTKVLGLDISAFNQNYMTVNSDCQSHQWISPLTSSIVNGYVSGVSLHGYDMDRVDNQFWYNSSNTACTPLTRPLLLNPEDSLDLTIIKSDLYNINSAQEVPIHISEVMGDTPRVLKSINSNLVVDESRSFMYTDSYYGNDLSNTYINSHVYASSLLSATMKLINQGASTIYPWQLFDQYYPSAYQGHKSQHGLLTRELEKRNAYKSLQLLSEAFSSGSRVYQIPTDQQGSVVIVENEKEVNVVVNNDDTVLKYHEILLSDFLNLRVTRVKARTPKFSMNNIDKLNPKSNDFKVDQITSYDSIQPMMIDETLFVAIPAHSTFRIQLVRD